MREDEMSEGDGVVASKRNRASKAWEDSIKSTMSYRDLPHKT